MSTLSDATNTPPTTAAIVPRSASTDTLTDSPDVPQITQPQLPFYLKDEYVPRNFVEFEFWIQSVRANRASPVTAPELERWSLTIIHRVLSHQKRALIHREEEKYFQSKVRGVSRLLKWALSDEYKEFKERKAANLRHMEECRWCKVVKI
ncbi:hypothetical protein HK104_005795 [Borealophlyctis nickersoniae]|nr:hypothetical protein HK104_005795 [Borealophlyctis nickersoniae]